MKTTRLRRPDNPLCSERTPPEGRLTCPKTLGPEDVANSSPPDVRPVDRPVAGTRTLQFDENPFCRVRSERFENEKRNRSTKSIDNYYCCFIPSAYSVT